MIPWLARDRYGITRAGDACRMVREAAERQREATGGRCQPCPRPEPVRRRACRAGGCERRTRPCPPRRASGPPALPYGGGRAADHGGLVLAPRGGPFIDLVEHTDDSQAPRWPNSHPTADAATHSPRLDRGGWAAPRGTGEAKVTVGSPSSLPETLQQLRHAQPHPVPRPNLASTSCLRVVWDRQVLDGVANHPSIDGTQESGLHGPSAPPLHLGFVVPDACPQLDRRPRVGSEAAGQQANA